MTVTLPDDPALLRLDEGQLKLEIACALFASGRVSRGVARRIAGLDSLAFDEELFRRKIPTWTVEMFEQDMAAVERLHLGLLGGSMGNRVRAGRRARPRSGRLSHPAFRRPRGRADAGRAVLQHSATTRRKQQSDKVRC